jgi:hypothetical protein|tara:strand:+ start:1395 stop:1610 length:216 start_codon:yes stop_codon:yes gene_type:complete
MKTLMLMTILVIMTATMVKSEETIDVKAKNFIVKEWTDTKEYQKKQWQNGKDQTSKTWIKIKSFFSGEQDA